MGRHEPSLWWSGQFGAMVRDAMQRNFGRCSPRDTWSPAVNVYQLPHGLEVCVDLAGVRREELDVRVEPGRLLIRGIRHAPEPEDAKRRGPMRILGMEIDYGPFQREIALPQDIVLEQVQSNYTDGMLWITLPVNSRSRRSQPTE